MIPLKTPAEIKIMKEAGLIAGQVLKNVFKKVRAGLTKQDLENFATAEILKFNAQPSFKMVPGYKFSTCLTVNEEVVHGIPNDYILKEGDIIGIDLGVFWKGFHADTAGTVLVGRHPDPSEEKKIKSFLQTGQIALQEAIKQVKIGTKIRDISIKIQENIEKNGYSVVENLVGHGIGKKLHEPPQIPGFITNEEGPTLKEGMVLAIEVIYNQGRPDVKYQDYSDKDQWTIVSKDKSLSGLFEHTVAVTRQGPIVLTK